MSTAMQIEQFIISIKGDQNEYSEIDNEPFTEYTLAG